MNTYRNNPDSTENADATRDNERAVFAAKMQAKTATAPEITVAVLDRVAADLYRIAASPQTTPHTPGPWNANADTVWRGGQPIVCHPINSPRSIADARLIAAAPALLAALERALPHLIAMMITSGGDGSLTVAEARAAIAKAKGGEAK